MSYRIVVNILSSGIIYSAPWCREEMQPFFQETSRVLVILFSFDEDVGTSEKLQELYNPAYGKYYSDVTTPLIELGVKAQNIVFLDYFRRDLEKALEEIAEGDVIY